MESSRANYRFGEWIVEPELNRLSNSDAECHLEPRTMDVLGCLLADAGQVVGTDELLDQVWNGRHAEPHMVAKRISQIRHALGDDAREPRYIETVSKRGYRTLETVVPLENRDDRSTEPDLELATSTKPVLKATSLHKRIGGYALLLSFLLVLATWLASSFVVDRPEDPIRSIAVLPLDNMSGDPGQQYVADGMTEEIITELGKVKKLQVTSRTSVMRYQSDRPSIRTIAQELGVDTIVEGSIAREGRRFRVTVQIIDANTDSHIWANSFDREESSVLALRSDIARAVASQLDLALSGDEQVALQYQRRVNIDAYDAYLRSLSYFGTAEHFVSWAPSAIAELERAVEIDVGFAEAWARLALFEVAKAVWVGREHFATAQEYAEKAMAIDGNLAVAHTAIAYVLLLKEWDLRGAEESFTRALELSPNDASVLQGYLIYLQVQERSDEAMDVAERLLAVAPGDLSKRSERVTYIYDARLYEQVITEADKIRVIEPSFHTADEAAAYHRLGRFYDSHLARLAAYRSCGAPCDQARSAAEVGWNEGGYEGSLRALAEEGYQENERGRYWFHAQLGNSDAAFANVEELAELRAPWLVGIRYHPDFDALRLDPRYDELRVRMGLPSLADNPSRTADTGRLLAFRGQAQEAIDHLNRAMRESPRNLRYSRWVESMAWAQFAASDYEETVRWAEQALGSTTSRHTTAFCHLLQAASLSHLDRSEEAREALLKARGLWPTTLEVERDLLPFFIGGDQDMRDRYIAGLRMAGLDY